MASPCIGFEIGLGHICWYFRAYICSKILKVLHPCIGFGIGLGHIWGHANAWIWYIHAYAWILYIHVLSHISHIPKAEIFGFMFQYLSSERMGLRFWANPIHNTWLDHGEISRTRCTPNRPAVSGDYSGSEGPQLRCFRWDAISWRWPVESPSSWLGEAASFSSPEEQTVHSWRERSSVKIINRGGFFLYFGECHNLRLIQILDLCRA